MLNKKVGLILEGGGFRGIFTAGILDYFLEKDLEFPYVIGVSMGSCNGVNYISKQKRRSIDIPYTYIKDHRYISYRNLLTKRSLFGMDFIFHEIPYKHNEFDFETFRDSKQKFLIGTMDVHKGGSRFFDAHDLSDHELLLALKASCSLPYISPMVSLRGGRYLDGGLSDSIPVRKAIEDGMDKVVVLVTREEGYEKAVKERKRSSFIYRAYPQVGQHINNRSIKYNQELEYMKDLEDQGKAFVIYPDSPIEIGRTERNAEKLMKAYEDGYRRAGEVYEDLLKFLGEEEPFDKTDNDVYPQADLAYTASVREDFHDQ